MAARPARRFTAAAAERAVSDVGGANACVNDIVAAYLIDLELPEEA